MIVRSVRDHLQLITQPAHAQLARRIMEHCVPLAARARRQAILHAIAEHDNGWAEEDAMPSVHSTSGTIIDFVTAPLSVRAAVWPRGVARLADHPWAAALVAQHAIVIHDRFRSDAEWGSFFAGMTAARDAMLRATGLQLDDLLVDYEFVRLADLISLAFCTEWEETQRAGRWTVQLSGTTVIVTPDAFGDAEVAIEIVASEIPNQLFRSDAELRDALTAATSVMLLGKVTGKPT